MNWKTANGCWLVLFVQFFHPFTVDALKGSGIFKLPDLTVETNSTYLLRGINTQLKCEIQDPSNEWQNATLDRIYWIRDGTPTAELKNDHNEFIESKGVLTLTRASHSNEGEYQCSAIVRNIQLATNTVVDSRLVSAPVKLRRARITKFERYVSEAVRVKAGEVARIPCFGLPDVVPGPPEIWFEKQGHEGVQLGRTGNQRFIATPTGLQIALTQPVDAGRYYCMVRNSFMNITRAAPKPIILKVDPSSERRRPSELRKPKIIYPLARNYSEPIEYHVVVGQTAVLECVIADSVIRWNKPDFSMPDVSIDNDRARIRQVWGNLRIKHVTLDDSDDYICHGLKEYNDSELRQLDHPHVIYRLIVHAPTTVRLMLNQQAEDKFWQLSCFAHNLWYEIPMVFVNGLALIDAMDEMGVPPQTNFYTNPINVTLKASNPLEGSVQCISRPAMEEAEVYGPGLERGQSMNLYVDKRLSARPNLIAQGPSNSTRTIGTRVQMTCVPLGIDNLHVQWLKDGKPLDVTKNRRLRLVGSASLEIVSVRTEDAGFYTCQVSDRIAGYKNEASAELFVSTQGNNQLPNFPAEDAEELVQFELTKPTVFMDSEQNARVQWVVKASSDKNANLREFILEFRQRDPMRDNSTTLWTETDRVPSHVRAKTLRRLNPLQLYQFRVIALFTGGFTEIYSPPTEWMGFIEPRPSAPFAPRITRLETISHSSILIAWEQITGSHLNSPENFVIRCEDTDTEAVREIRVENITRELLVTDLNDDTEYQCIVFAENSSSGRSAASRPKIARTYVVVDDPNNWTIMGVRGAVFLAFVCLLSAAIPLVCVLAFMVLRKYYATRSSLGIQPHNRSPHHQLNGQKEDFFGKSQTYQDPLFLNGDPIHELAPLNYAMDDRDNDPLDIVPSIYGDKPFASIRGSGRADLQHGSQASLNNPSIGFRRFIHKPTDAGLYGTSGALNMSGIFHHLSGNDERAPLTAEPQAASTLNRHGRSPSVTRSALSVFTGLNGRPQIQRRHPIANQNGVGISSIMSSPAEGEMPTTSTSPGSANSGATHLQHNSPQYHLHHQFQHHVPPSIPPPIPERTYGLRSATSSVELSSSFRNPNAGAQPSLRTFAADTLSGGEREKLSEPTSQPSHTFEM
ncbi:Hemicentin-1 [Aphelenchoides besseyi]|nr:Hemicentin-1 [Aphelenchoides besseyi]